MKEAVSERIAFTLKDKGFHERVAHYYVLAKDGVAYLSPSPSAGADWNEYLTKTHCSAPGILQVVTWLANKHKLYVEIALYDQLQPGKGLIYKLTREADGIQYTTNGNKCNSIKEAIEKAIEEALTYIKDE